MNTLHNMEIRRFIENVEQTIKRKLTAIEAGYLIQELIDYSAQFKPTAEADTNTVLGDVQMLVKELLEVIDSIPCTCDEMYKSRRLTAPDCPRCNYVDDEILAKAKKHFA